MSTLHPIVHGSPTMTMTTITFTHWRPLFIYLWSTSSSLCWFYTLLKIISNDALLHHHDNAITFHGFTGYGRFRALQKRKPYISILNHNQALHGITATALKKMFVAEYTIRNTPVLPQWVDHCVAINAFHYHGAAIVSQTLAPYMFVPSWKSWFKSVQFHKALNPNWIGAALQASSMSTHGNRLGH